MNLNALFHNKSYLLLLGGGVLLLIVIFMTAFFLLRPQTAPETTQQTVTPTVSSAPKDPNDPYSDAYKESVKKINQQEKSLLDQDEKVSAFINSLPLQGTNFTAAYDIGTNTVTVTIPESKKAEGEKEFDAYLQSKGIKERSWIQNLIMRYPNSDPDAH